MGYRFVPGYDRVQGMSMFKFFFSAVFAGSRFVEMQKFCYYGNVT